MDLDPSAFLSDCSEFHAQFKRFRLLPFRSPLLRECFPALLQEVFSFPPATKMFQFTGYSSHYLMCSDNGLPLFKRKGFPIRRFPGHRLLATSPRLIAGCYVLHRLLMSRHPPYTLNVIFSHY